MPDITELKRGDSDRRNVWGGSKLVSKPPYPVKKLQSDLKTVGAYTGKIDGGFGKVTERALKVFQWCLVHSTHTVSKGKLVTHQPITSIKINGILQPESFDALIHWIGKQKTVSGDLVRIDMATLNHIGLSPGFKHIAKNRISKSELVISAQAFTMLELMNKIAKQLGLTIMLNQVLRLNNVKVNGAVVPPATKSQHLIGHAIDCNIVDGDRWNTSRDFKYNRQTAGAEKFIAKMKKAKYRWGGDFTRVDTPHFDKQLDSSAFSYDSKFYLNQRQIASSDPIETQTIAN